MIDSIETAADRHLVEVYVEEDCSDCRQVVKLLGEMRKTIDFTLKVYGKDERELPMNHREIFVVPATFVDKKLIFYGRFGTKTIRKYLTSPVAKPTGLSE